MPVDSATRNVSGVGNVVERRLAYAMLRKLGDGSFNQFLGNDSNLLIVFYVQIMPDDFVMQLHRF